MATKKKQPTNQFIALDNRDEEVIGLGTFEHIKECIQEYCNDDWDEDDISKFIEVYELGNKRKVHVVARGFTVNF